MTDPREQVSGAQPFRLREVAVAAYGPTLVSSIGYGAVTPMLALRARDLGADVGTAALVVSLFGFGMLMASLPAGAVVARLGERRTLLFAGFVDAAAMVAAALSTSVAAFGAAIVVSGMAWTAFLIARQGFMIEAVPVSHRARAMSTLGGTFRIGIFIGPLLGAALITGFGLGTVFLLSGALSLAAGVLAQLMPDLGVDSRREERDSGFASVWSVLRAHRRTLLTLGVAVVVISASRSVRTGLLPLWADQIGLGASTISLIFAGAAFIDIVMFYPGGWLMDRHGRSVVALPIVLGVALACLLLPQVTTATGLAGILALISFANGLGSGIVMTIGADTAPLVGRAQYLGGWRLCGDIGNTGGPLLVSAVTLVAPLATACVVVGVLGLVGSAWVGYWTRQLDSGLARGKPVRVSRS
ncbi:MAG: MFS transporter [Nocardioides sp.]